MITRQALAYFGLTADPFAPLIKIGDIYTDPAIDQAVSGLRSAIRCGQMVAITGPTGSGKSVLVERTLSSMPDERIVRALAISRANLSGAHLCHAILEDIAGRVVYGSLERRARAVRECLSALQARGQHAALLVDDAHVIPDQTLRDLKSLHEICGVLSSPLSIVLIAQPDLSRRLSDDIPLRGVGYRTTTTRMPATNTTGYLSWCFARSGGAVAAAFTPCGIEAIDAHPDADTYIGLRRVAAQAMVLAARVHSLVDAEVVAHLSSVPVPSVPAPARPAVEAA